MAENFTSYNGDIRWLDVKNVGDAEIPPWGLMRVTEVEPYDPADNDTGNFITVDQPGSDGQDVLVNSEVAIDYVAPANRGTATRDTPIWIAYDTNDGTPVNGESWGAGAGSYLLRKGNQGFQIVGGAVEGRVLATRAIAPAGGGARIYNSAPQVINGVGAISFDTVRFDTNTYYSAGHPTRLVVPTTGYYMIGGHATVANAGNPPDFAADGFIRLTGVGFGVMSGVAGYIAGQKSFWSSATGDPWISLSTLWYAIAGDYFEFYIEEGSAGGSTIYTTIGAASPEFWIFKVG